MKKLMIVMMIIVGIGTHAERDKKPEYKTKEKAPKETQDQYIEKMSRGTQSHKKLNLSVDEVIKQNRKRRRGRDERD